MFRNPVYDMIVVIPALLIAGLIGFFVMSTPAHAETLPASTLATSTATSTGSVAITASTSGTTLPDPTQKVLVITRAVVPGASISTSTPAVAIHSSAQLSAYARGILSEDPYMQSITLSAFEISVSYRKSGRLLGLLPVTLPTRVTVRNDGSVSFTAPWYSVVTLEERDRMRTGLEVRVHSLLTSEGYLASMSLAPATQAEILDIIRELLG